MAIIIKTPSQVADEYLLELKALKPEVNTDQKDTEWWIRSRVLGGLSAGLYADQRLLANDPFPQRARRDALSKHLEIYFTGDNALFKPATAAQGIASVTGTIGSSILTGLEFLYAPNGNVYQAQENLTLVSVTGSVAVKSVSLGQAQNLLAGAALTISSPPAGIQASAKVLSDLADARDPETETEAATRIIDRIRSPLSVGRESDYIQYARDADPSVVSASVVRYPFGLGTVGVYITSGTTDIDTAIDNGDSISTIPSDALVATVQAFLEENKPVTDCVTVFKPVAVPIDVTAKVKFANGTSSTIPSGQTLTQSQLVKREVSRAIYKTPIGGRRFNGGVSGYVVASELEETIDAGLGGGPVVSGKLLILVDRQVSDLSLTGSNRLILANQAAVPGVITVVEF